MYEAIEHWKQYKQEKSNNKAMKMTPFLIKLVKQKQAEKQMDNFINKLVVNNGETNI